MLTQEDNFIQELLTLAGIPNLKDNDSMFLIEDLIQTNTNADIMSKSSDYINKVHLFVDMVERLSLLRPDQIEHFYYSLC